MAVAAPRRLFTVEEYHRMGEAGIFGPEERVELICGEIIPMHPIGSPHARAVTLLNQMLSLGLGERALVSVQNPVVLDDESEPQPDVTVLQPNAYAGGRHPRPEDVVLLVEVSETLLSFDRSRKVPIYAARKIPEVWVVNLVERQVDVHRAPIGGTYRTTEIVRAGGTLSPLGFPEIELPVDRILG